jgi:outer membrane cobalamin receptor
MSASMPILFPSVHVTYDFAKQNAFQLSFSRRVRRPQYNDLTPFATYSDNRNYWSGNPDLNPEFTNAFELGHIKYMSKGSLTSSVYYRHTNGKITVSEEFRKMEVPTHVPKTWVRKMLMALNLRAHLRPINGGNWMVA